MEMTKYHKTHYEMFHVTLPEMLLESGARPFLQLAALEELTEFLAEVWNDIAESTEADDAEVDIDMASDDFGVLLDNPAPGWYTILIGTPEVRGPLEAAMVAIAFSREAMNEPMYFTCEAPFLSDFPWMIGRIHSPGMRANLGPIHEVHPVAMLDFVAQMVADHLGMPVAKRQGEAGQAKINLADLDLPGQRSRDSSWTEDFSDDSFPDLAPVSIPVVDGPVAFSLKWSAEPHDLAEETLQNLYRLYRSGGFALVVSTKKARGLGRNVSSYIQFMWDKRDGLIVEIQSDYSYWGKAIPSSAWPQFERCGLSIPQNGFGNFTGYIEPGVTHEERVNELAAMFGAFIAVLQPSGSVVIQPM